MAVCILGANTCEACKAFFRRSLNQKEAMKPCPHNGTCADNPKGKITCSSCRHKKCISIGMTREGTLASGCRIMTLSYLNSVSQVAVSFTTLEWHWKIVKQIYEKQIKIYPVAARSYAVYIHQRCCIKLYMYARLSIVLYVFFYSECRILGCTTLHCNESIYWLL